MRGKLRKDKSTTKFAGAARSQAMAEDEADEAAAVKSRRLSYNLMIQNHGNNFSHYLHEDMVQVASSGSILTGLDNVAMDYVLDDYTNDSFIAYERLPDAVTISSCGNIACERGHWRGRFKGDREGVEVGGRGMYQAEWRKVNQIWKIKAELYTKLE